MTEQLERRVESKEPITIHDRRTEVLEALKQIQSDLKAPKSQFNSYGKYRYRSAEDVLDALKPHLNKLGCVVLLSDQLEVIGDRHYIRATATLTHSATGASVSVFGYAREEAQKKGMDSSQITGACSSYARKYALNGLFAIDDNADSDQTNTHGKVQNQQSPPPIANPREYVFQNGELAGKKLCDIDVSGVEVLQRVFDNYGSGMPQELQNAIKEHLAFIKQLSANQPQPQEMKAGGF